MPLLPVADPADPRLEPFRDVRERDLVGRRGLFLAEGETVVRQMLRAGRFPLEALLVAERKAARFADLLAAEPDLPLYAAAPAVFDAVAGFPVHRGVLGLGRRPPDLGPEALLAAAPPRALVLAALGIGDHDNMGALFRNAAAFGAHAVLLGADACDPLYRKAIRVSVGAALTTPFSRLPPGVDLPALLVAHGFGALALSPAAREPLATVARPARAALIVGAEGPGLPAELLARCRTLSIPMVRGFDSLNVATAAAIALHHLFGSGRVTTFFTADTHFGDHRTLNIWKRPFASVAEMDARLVAEWNAAVRPDDVVWHLGDFARTAAVAARVLPLLNGTKHLILGNNDPQPQPEGWASVAAYAELKLDGRALVLCHYPFRTWNGVHRGALNLHGHSHGRLKPLLRQFDVGVDARGWRPVTVDALLPPRAAPA